MKRLLKIALGGNIQTSDVDFIETNNEIEMILKNKEKSLHEGPWEDTKYYSNVDEEENSIGWIQWTIDIRDDIAVIYVNYLEIRPEYRSTRVVKYLLDKFKEIVLMKYIDQYGKDKVFLHANFENTKLSDMLHRITEKEVGIKWLYQDQKDQELIEISNANQEFANMRNNFCEKIDAKGWQTITAGEMGNSTTVVNTPYNEYEKLADECNFIVNTIYGYLKSNNGDVIYTYDWDEFQKLYHAGDDLEISYFGELLQIYSNEYNIAQLPDVVFENIKLCFGDTAVHVELSERATRPYQNLEELKQALKNQTNSISASRLRKR